MMILWSCISFDSYIKPQHAESAKLLQLVVYLLIPTSNHNRDGLGALSFSLYIFWFLHQTTTVARNMFLALALYIFWFLHQTTTTIPTLLPRLRCISFDSYIKPQQAWHQHRHQRVVYLLIPTSNHNSGFVRSKNFKLYIFWFLHQTTTCDGIRKVSNELYIFDSYIKPQLEV